MIRNIIWDAGGTLFDSYPATTRAFLSALAQFGVEADAVEVRALAQVSQQHAAGTLARRYALDAERFWQTYQEFRARANPEDMPPFPGAREVCQAIVDRDGLNLIATHRGIESIHDLLQTHALAPLFAAVVTTADGFPRKPDPAMLNWLVEKFNLTHTETLAIGDREIDIQSARAAGLPTCLYRGKSSLPADLTIQDYTELLPLLATRALRDDL